jgi:hypothetical protein
MPGIRSRMVESKNMADDLGAENVL